MSKKVSIIIINYNNDYNIRCCLESVLGQNNRSKLDIEIIVVDSGSSDESIKVIKEYQNKGLIKAIFNNKRDNCPWSPSLSRNIGAEEAKGEILLFTDSDCLVFSDWVEKMLMNFDKTDIACVFGGKNPDIGQGLGAFYRRLYTLIYSRKFRWFKKVYLNKDMVTKIASFILMASNNMAIKKKAWLRVGCMDELFSNPAGEDVILEFKLIKSGYTLLFDPNIRIRHNHPLGLYGLIKKSWQQGEAIYLGRHMAHYVAWKHFVELNNFLKNIIFTILIFVIILFLSVNTKVTFSVGVFVILLFVVKRLSELKTRLKMALEAQDSMCYFKYSKISYFALFIFDILDFIAKGSRILGYAFYSIKGKK